MENKVKNMTSTLCKLLKVGICFYQVQQSKFVKNNSKIHKV